MSDLWDFEDPRDLPRNEAVAVLLLLVFGVDGDPLVVRCDLDLLGLVVLHVHPHSEFFVRVLDLQMCRHGAVYLLNIRPNVKKKNESKYWGLIVLKLVYGDGLCCG